VAYISLAKIQQKTSQIGQQLFLYAPLVCKFTAQAHKSI